MSSTATSRARCSTPTSRASWCWPPACRDARPADTVTLACASACQAITDATNLIERGYADVVIAGGVEMLSNVPIALSPPLARALVGASQARSMGARVQSFSGLALADLPPQAPTITETSTGLSMGQSAELMAKLNGISREDQDAWALGSHQKAAAAWDDGRLAEEVAPVFVVNNGGRAVTKDNHIRRDTSLEKLAQLNRSSTASYGTVTAGNSRPLTDGAASVLLMSEDRRRASLGYTPKAFVRSYAYAAVDPSEQLLIGPAYAIPKALERAGLTLERHRPGRDARGIRRAGAVDVPEARVEALRRSSSGDRRRW